MKTYNNLYGEIISLKNLVSAYKKAKKHKTKKIYVLEFEKNLGKNLRKLHYELQTQIYSPKPLQNFILRDPKTRKISKSDFRDRIVHHALVRIIEPIFDKGFIYDSCANRIGKGNLFAIGRFDKFKRKVTNNLTSGAYCLKADIKHYFEEVNHDILFGVLSRKIKDEKVLLLIKKIIRKGRCENNSKGMPLGNLTSQFFANVYLDKLDKFVKHKLKAKYYVRYVDDFVILHESKEKLDLWKIQIKKFLQQKLKLELHGDKSKIINLSKGIDFVGFRNFYYHKLLRKRNIKSLLDKINLFNKGIINDEKFSEILQGWNAYAKWANTYNLRKKLIKEINLYSKPS